MTENDPAGGASRKGAGGGSGRSAGQESEDDRRARLEQALRANLRRRKAQSRARAEPAEPVKPSDGRE
ncbi:hypothetical protein [Thalassobaculum sp.]|uniref:hypothetical protein n=1 Tax=Thalassobaculum sp. TaxID=2022740 RepID=UPI0032EEED27